jgi:hypothetical protein
MPLPFSRRALQTAPSFSRDFAGLKTLDHGVGPAITFTRASDATYFDADGVLQAASNNVPRFDHSGGSSLGLLIEEARTNSIRNSQAGGAVAGTPGTPPTNWPLTGTAGGLTREIVATGTSNGLAYIDIKFSGIVTAATFQIALDPESGSQVAASSGQTWTNSAYIALISGSVPDCNIGITERLADGTFVTASTTNTASSLTSALQRFSHTRTLTDATTARVSAVLRVTATNGATINFTLRIAAPQLEQGAFATSYIPTTTAAATRAADSAVVTPISSFYNQSEGTIYNEFTVPVLDGASTLRGISMFTENAGIQNRFQSSFRGTGLHAFAAASANVAEWDITSAAGLITAGTNNRLAMGYNMAGNHARSYNGAAVATSSTAGATPTRERLLLGFNGSAHMNGHIRKIAYWPRRLSNTLLQQLTT